jgi:hypothetical protein
LNGVNDDDIYQCPNTIHQNHNIDLSIKKMKGKQQKCGFIHIKCEILHPSQSTQKHPKQHPRDLFSSHMQRNENFESHKVQKLATNVM